MTRDNSSGKDRTCAQFPAQLLLYELVNRQRRVHVDIMKTQHTVAADSSDRPVTGFWRFLAGRPELLIALVLLLPLSIFIHRPHWAISDDRHGTELMNQVYEKQVFYLPMEGEPRTYNETKGPDGRIYFAFNPGPYLYAAPFYLLGRALENVISLPPQWIPRANNLASIIARLSWGILLAAAFPLLVSIARQHGASQKSALLYALAVVFSTPFFLAAQSNYNHAPNAFGLILAFAAFTRDLRRPHWTTAVACGVGLGFSITCRTVSYFYPALFGTASLVHLVRHRNWRMPLGIIAGSAAGVAVNLAYNYVRFGSFFSLGYDERTRVFISLLQGLPRYFLLPDDSLLLSMPAILLVPVACFYLKRPRSVAGWLGLAIFVVHFFFYASYLFGSGFVPSRFMTAIGFLVLLPVALVLDNSRRLTAAFVCLALFGLFLNVLHSVGDPVTPPEIQSGVYNWRAWHQPNYIIFHNFPEMFYRYVLPQGAWQTGMIDWFGAIYLGGKSACLTMAVYFLAAGILLYQLCRRVAGRSTASIAAGSGAACVAIMGIGSIFLTSPSQPLSSADEQLISAHIDEKRGRIFLDAVLNFKERKPWQVRLVLKPADNPQAYRVTMSQPVTFGAPFLNTTHWLPNRQYPIRMFFDPPANMPSGPYRVEVDLNESGKWNFGTVNIDPPPLILKESIIPAKDMVATGRRTPTLIELGEKADAIFCVHAPYGSVPEVKLTSILALSPEGRILPGSLAGRLVCSAGLSGGKQVSAEVRVGFPEVELTVPFEDGVNNYRMSFEAVSGTTTTCSLLATRVNGV